MIMVYGAWSFAAELRPHHQIVYHLGHTDLVDIQKELATDLADPLYLIDVTYASDVAFSRDEFIYLIGFDAGDTVCHEQLYKLFYYLSKKRKFERITLSLYPHEKGYALHVDLEAFWTFNGLKLKGIFVGKEHVKQYYLMESQDYFDMRKHADSVQKIVDSFKADGYFQATIQEKFFYRDATKSVDVQLELHKGSRFYITGVQVVVEHPSVVVEDKDSLALFLQDHLAKRLLKSYYHKEQIADETGELKHLLMRKGYVHVDVILAESINYGAKTTQLTFTVVLQAKKQFLFQGNHFFSREQLLEHITAFGRAASLLPASILSDELLKLYHDKGFWQASITLDDDTSSCQFTITEGQRISIDVIQLQYIDPFQEDYLVKKFFYPLLKKRFYEATVQNECIERCLAYMVQEGFWQASVHAVSFEALDTRQSYQMIITFDLGQQRRLKSVTVGQMPELQAQGPFKRYGDLTASIPFNPNIIEEQRLWLKHFFKKQGYYNMRVTPELQGTLDNLTMAWQTACTMKQERQKVVILGSNTFPFAYVKRELDYAVGDQWHRDTMRYVISRLKKIEVFDAVHLIPDKVSEDDPEGVILLKLQQDDPYEIRMRTGFGVQHITKSLTSGGWTYRIGGSFIYKNPTNSGDQLRLDADCTRAIRLVNAQYRRPWLFGLPLNGMFQGYTNRFEYPGFIGSQLNLYTVIQQGFLVNINTVYNNLDAAMSTGIEVIDTFIDESTPEQALFAQQVARAINFRPDLLDKNIPFFLMQPTFILYNVDSTVNPTRGSFSIFSAKAMFPLSKLDRHNFFIRLLGEQSFFLPIWPFVIALRIRIGHIFHPKFSTIIPIERFYLGGANSIRSYETDQCPPLGIVEHEGQTLYVPQGGRSLANLNLELRFPLYKQLGGVVFGDIGALSTNRLADIKPHDVLSGIGVGLRYNTPIGPLRFDIAWRGRKHDGVGRPYAWFLSFGNAFI
jgi:outer membrane protein assembly factor BamA